jgi:TolB-like protein/Tfp pilus assembly protein PilF
MSSIIEGYSYDIFISYRQNDNKYDGWVTEFVDNLSKELEANIKDKISVYFDINPQDGLLETDSVDKSLEDKLRCLIFIPIISRTYCDSKSFAWQHEFCAFNKLAKEDRFGRDIKLSSGNVASRILPIKIHDIDAEDKTLLENELKGVLRGIEFIYKEAGVNRPLKPNDDAKENLNRTQYRNQVNKVANAVKEIISALKKQSQHPEEVTKQDFEAKHFRKRDLSIKIIAGSLILLALIVAGYFLYPKFIKPQKNLEKSIAVLPFDNLSNDPEQEYFCDGMLDEILDRLFRISDLKVVSRTSSMRYKDSKLALKEIAKELDVSTILEGSIHKVGNNVRITVQLIDAKTDNHLWSKIYDKDLSDILKIQSEIALRIAEELKTMLTPEEKGKIENSHTKNPEAYNLYLQGRYFWYRRTKEDLKRSVEYFEKSITTDPDYALAYAGLADAYYIQAFWGWLPWDEGTAKSKELALRALDIDKNLAEAHTVLGALLTYREWKWEEARKEFQLAIELNPKYVTAHHYYSELLDILRQNGEARKHINIALQLDPFLPVLHVLSSSYYFNEGKLKESLDECFVLEELDPEYSHRLPYWKEFNIYCRQKEDFKALETLQKAFFMDTLKFKSAKDVYNKSGINGILNWFIETELKKSNPSALGLAHNFANFNKKEEALYWLEEAFKNPPTNFLESSNSPDWDILRSEPRFQAIIKKMGLSEYQEPN